MASCFTQGQVSMISSCLTINVFLFRLLAEAPCYQSEVHITFVIMFLFYYTDLITVSYPHPHVTFHNSYRSISVGGNWGLKTGDQCQLLW